MWWCKYADLSYFWCLKLIKLLRMCIFDSHDLVFQIRNMGWEVPSERYLDHPSWAPALILVYLQSTEFLGFTETSMWLFSNLSGPYWLQCFLSSWGPTSEEEIRILMCPVWGLLSVLSSLFHRGIYYPFHSPTEENGHHMEEVTFCPE